MAARFRSGGREILFLDPETFGDTGKNVRGGMPVLFPTPGRLSGDRWDRNGRQGTLPQHGFARNLAWEIRGTSSTGVASATLRLQSCPASRANYPYDFNLECAYSLKGSGLTVEIAVTNTGAEVMPFGVGFHPYFLLEQSEKAGARVETRATGAFDNVSKHSVRLEGPIDLARDEVDLHLLDHGSNAIALVWSGGLRRIQISASPEFSHWVVWTLAGRDFVCVEPWTCPPDAFNSGDRLSTLSPGATQRLWFRVDAVDRR
jgi:galactose mutarotase-like enzyme